MFQKYLKNLMIKHKHTTKNDEGKFATDRHRVLTILAMCN